LESLEEVLFEENGTRQSSKKQKALRINSLCCFFVCRYFHRPKLSTTLVITCKYSLSTVISINQNQPDLWNVSRVVLSVSLTPLTLNPPRLGEL